MNRFVIFLAFLFISISSILNAQVVPVYGTDFWMGFMDGGNGSVTELYISSEIATCGKVEIPLKGWSVNFTVAANSTTKIDVPNSLVVTQGTEIIQGGGVHITSHSPVNVVSFNHYTVISDAALILPANKLGIDYTVFSHDDNYTSQGPEIMVVAAQNNTDIQITSTVVTKAGKPAMVPFTVTLNQGQVYQVKSPGFNSSATPPPGDFTGTRVISTNGKPFALFGGNSCSTIGLNCCCDPLIEQFYPVPALGTEYITTPLKTKAGDYFKVLAVQNGTTFQINGGAPIALNANQFYATMLTPASYISANNPIGVAQYCTSKGVDGVANSDPFMIQLLPLNSTMQRSVFSTFNTSAGIVDFYANILTKTADVGSLTFDGAPVASFVPVPANNTYSYAQLKISNGPHVIFSEKGYTGISYGFGGAESYGYTIGDNRYFDTVIVCPNASATFNGYTSSPSTQWTWDFGDGTPTNNNQNPSHTYTTNGTYTVSMLSGSSSFSCTDTVKFIVNTNAMTLSITGNSTVCSGNPVTLTASSGFTNYSWNTGATTSSLTISPTASSIYTVTASNGSGCTVTATESVTVNTAPTATISAQTNVSCGGNNGTATATAGGGTSPYTYAWSNGQNVQTSTGLSPGTYSVTVTDSKGCMQSNTVTIASGSSVTLNASSTQSGCAINNGTATVNPTNGTLPYTYAWSNGQTLQTISGLAAGTYSVAVTDAGGCMQSQTVSVTQTPGPAAAVTTSANVVAAGGSATLSASGGVTYQWSPAAGLDCTTCANPIATPLQTTAYCVTATDASGCTDSDCVTISLDIPCGTLYLPNAFSPNNDLENDEECVLGACIELFHIVIYDRWGEKVFETSDPKICWDGKYKGKLLDTSVFSYYMDATLTNGNKINQKGNISLVR